ncbi:hypothetical protein, partial [Frankia sp. AvcI1]
FEDLGLLGPLLSERGYRVRYLDVGDPGDAGDLGDPGDPGDPGAIRADAARHGARLASRARLVFHAWLDQVDASG